MVESTEADSLVVGVAGGSCAGKSTVSRDMSEMIQDSAVLAMDHYYHSRPIEGDRIVVNFDEPEAIDFQLLKYHLKQMRLLLGINRPVTTTSPTPELGWCGLLPAASAFWTAYSRFT